MKWEIQQSIRTIDQGQMMQQPTTDNSTTINVGGEVLFHHFFSIANKHNIQAWRRRVLHAEAVAMLEMHWRRDSNNAANRISIFTRAKLLKNYTTISQQQQQQQQKLITTTNNYQSTIYHLPHQCLGHRNIIHHTTTNQGGVVVGGTFSNVK